MFSLFIGYTFSSIYSFDFGSKNVRTAIGVPGKPIEIVLNDQSSRSTPNQLAYALDANESQLMKEEWYFGADAERIIHKNQTHGVKNPFAYLASSEEFPIKNIDPITACSLVFSQHLRHFKRKRDKLIVAVPSIYTPHARRALIQSLKNINYSSIQLINSNTAVAALYAIERLPKNLTKPFNVLFIDIGAAQTEISLWSFQSQNNGSLLTLTLKDYKFSDKIGGDAIDDRLIKNITSQIGREPLKTEQINIANAVRRAKEQLAAGPDSTIDLMTDFNKRIPLTRKAVNEEIPDILEKYKSLLSKISQKYHVSNDKNSDENDQTEEIDEIELIGGTTRLPAIVEVTEEIFGNNILRRSLNSDEAVAIGAAYYAGLQMGTILGPRIEVNRPCLYGLNFILQNKSTPVFKSGEKIERRALTLRKFTDFNCSISLSFEPNSDIDSEMFNSVSNHLSLTDIEIDRLRALTRNLTSQLAKGTKPFLRFNFGHSQYFDDIDYLSSALYANVSLNVTIEGNESHLDSTPMSWNLHSNDFNYFPFLRQTFKSQLNKQPLNQSIINESENSSENDQQLKENKKSKKEELIFEMKEIFNYQEAINANKAEMLFVKTAKKAASERRKHAAALHNLEGFVIDFTDKLEYDEDFRNVTTEEERTEINNILSRERNTIDLSGSRVKSSELKKRLQKLKERMELPLLRYTEFKGRPAAIAQINKTIEKVKSELETAVCDEIIKNNVIQYMNGSIELMNKAIKILPLDYPHVTIVELKERNQKLQRLIPDLKRKAKPKTVTISTDPNSPDYDPEKLKELGIIITNTNSDNETKINDTEINTNSSINQEL